MDKYLIIYFAHRWDDIWWRLDAKQVLPVECGSNWEKLGISETSYPQGGLSDR